MLAHDVSAATYNGVTAVPANATANVSNILAACGFEAQVRFIQDDGQSDWNANDNPDFNLSYNIEQSATTRNLYVTSALLWDDVNMSSQWKDTVGTWWRVPKTGTFYAYNRTQITVGTGTDFVSGTADLGKINAWNRTGSTSAWITGLNHTGTFRMAVMVVSTSGAIEAEDWHGDSDQTDTSFGLVPGADCQFEKSKQTVGWIKARANVTSLLTANSTFLAAEKKFVLGDRVYMEFNLSANASIPTGNANWSAAPANMTLLVYNRTSHEVFRSPLAVNSTNKSFRVFWAMPESAALQDYNVTLNLSTNSRLLGESWTNFSSTGVGFVNQTASEVPIQTDLAPGGSPVRAAAFWVEKTLTLVMDAGMPRARNVVTVLNKTLNRGEPLEYSFILGDAWGRGLGARSVRVEMNTTTSHCTLNASVALNSSGGTGVRSDRIANDCGDSYASASPGTDESKEYAFHIHYPNTTTDPALGAYIENQTSFTYVDVDSTLYYSTDARLFGDVMRGDINRINATIVGARNDAPRINASVTVRLYDPSNAEQYNTNLTTGNDTGVTINWDRTTPNGDAVGTWTAKHIVVAANLTFNFNNTMAEATGSTFVVNNTIILNATSNVENNIYGETTGTPLKIYNKNETINITAILFHSDGGTYRIKSPTGDASRTLTVQLFNFTYGNGAFENTSSVSATTGRFSAVMNVNTGSAPNDTYTNNTPGLNESWQYDARFYDGGTTSSAVNGNDANATNVLDIDSQYYVNATTIPVDVFNRGGPSPQIDYRLTGGRGQYVNAGTGRVRIRDPSATVKSDLLVGFNNGWLNHTSYTLAADDQLGNWSTVAINSTGSGGNTFDETTSNAFKYTDELTITISNNVDPYSVPSNTSMDVRVRFANGTSASSLTFPFWWNHSFEYRQNITVSNARSTVARTNHPVQLTINTQSLTSAGKLNANASDVRFVDADGAELSYWIETTTNRTTTKIWVKMPTIPASSTRVMTMYYGYPAAESKSNGTNVFAFYDAYDADPSLATPAATCSPTNSYIRWNSTDKRIEFNQTGNECPVATPLVREQTLSSSVSGNSTRFHFNGTITNGGLTPADIEAFFGLVESVDAVPDKLRAHATGRQAALDVDVEGRVDDDDVVGASAVSGTDTRDSPFQGYLEASLNATHVMLYVYNDTGDLLATKNASVGATASDIENAWNKIEYRTIGSAAGTNFYNGWVDDYVVRSYTFPDPTFALGAEQAENSTRNITLSLQNATPSYVKHDHVFTTTNSTGYFNETDFRFTDTTDTGTWRTNATVTFDGNSGNATVTFTVGAVSVTLTIQSLNTYNDQLVGQVSFEEQEVVTIRSQITHSSTRNLIDRAFLNITSVNGTKFVNISQMTNISQVSVSGEDGYLYEYNYTIPEGPDEGDWIMDVFVNSTDALTDTAQAVFEVFSFRNVGVEAGGSVPHTLRIGSGRRARTGDIPLADG